LLRSAVGKSRCADISNAGLWQCNTAQVIKTEVRGCSIDMTVDDLSVMSRSYQVLRTARHEERGNQTEGVLGLGALKMQHAR